MTLVTIHRDTLAFQLWTGRLSPRGDSPRVGAELPPKLRPTDWGLTILVGLAGYALGRHNLRLSR